VSQIPYREQWDPIGPILCLGFPVRTMESPLGVMDSP